MGGAPALTLTLLLLSVLPARAQWTTTDWKVEQRKGVLQANRLAFLTGQLQEASQWLQGLGFADPALLVSGAAAGSPHFRAYYEEDLSSTCGNVLAHYDVNEETVYLGKALFESGSRIFSAADLTDGHVTTSDNRLLSPVHEVFHGVQYGHVSAWPAPLKWLLESTAEAVKYAWAEKNWGGVSLHYRWYDFPLHDPFVGAGCSALEESYTTGHFWYHLGGDIGATDRIGYLLEILKAVGANPDLGRRGLGPIAAALTPHSGGLYDLYPGFIARHAADTTFFRYEKLVDLGPNQPQVIDQEPLLKPLKGLATNAWLLRVTVPPGTTAGLKIRFADDHPDLHLIVDTTRYDRATPPDERNVFRTALTGQARPHELLVRVANVAPDAVGSADRRFSIEFTLAEVDACDGRQLWSALHPAAQRMLMPPQLYEQQHESVPGTHPAAGEFHIGGILTDGGTACANPAGRSANPQAPDRDAGLRLRDRVSRMSPQELQALAMRAAAGRGRGGPPPTMENVLQALQDEPMVDSLMVWSTLIQVYSPNALYWQRGVQPKSTGVPDLAAYSQDGPAVPWQHGGIGGWQPNSGAHAVLIIPDVAPSALREDTTYTVVGAMQYSRGEGILKQSRRNVNATSDGTWQGLEGWVEQVSNDPSVEPYSLKGTVRVRSITGAVIDGTFDLSGAGHYQRAECPPNPSNLASVSAKCTSDSRSGVLRISGRFAAPAVRRRAGGR